MKERPQLILTLLFLLVGLLSTVFCASLSYGYTINLKRSYVEHRADVTMIIEGSQSEYVPSNETPYAYAQIGDRKSAGAWAYNGRGFLGDVDVIDNHGRIENGLLWSDATIQFQGESGYNLPSPTLFLNSVSGHAISRVSYALDIMPRYGGESETEARFAIAAYENDYLEAEGWDSYQSVILKNREGDELFTWTGDEGLKTAYVPLAANETYALWMDSLGDFSDTVVVPESGKSGDFHTSVELLISVPEPIPIPSTLLLLGTSLTVLGIYRNRRRS
jgi:hypothetical protein